MIENWEDEFDDPAECQSITLRALKKLLEYGCYFLVSMCIALTISNSRDQTAPENPLSVRGQQESMIAEYEDELSGLHHWESCSREERLHLLETVIDCESKWLEIPAPPLSVETINPVFHEGRTLGIYNGEGIHIDEDHLMHDRRNDVLNTIFHEMFHAWQYAFLNAEPDQLFGYMRHKIDAYREEYRTPVQEISHEEYSFRELEIDARQYAVFRLPYYQTVLNLE